MAASEPRTVLAIASSGGHWKQLLQLADAWDGSRVVYATNRDCDLPGHAEGQVVPDASRSDKLSLIRLVFAVAVLVVRVRPSVVISTGAAPGLIGVILGRLIGARTVWVDSVANVSRLSLSGRLVRPFADLWLTQWPHLAQPEGPQCLGGVL